MGEEIVNRVAQSNLKVFDLEELYTPGPRTFLDLAQWLDSGGVLREHPFRSALNQTDWSRYHGYHIAIGVTQDLILPNWAFALVATHLSDVASTLVYGTLEQLEILLYERALLSVDFERFRGVPVILKGCSHRDVPQQAYMSAAIKLKKVAKKLSYGEACSAVPL